MEKAEGEIPSGAPRAGPDHEVGLLSLMAFSNRPSAMSGSKGIAIMKLHKNAEAAAYIGVTPGTLNVWRNKGRGPKHIKVGALVRYSEDELNAWLVARTRVSTSDHSQRKQLEAVA